MIILEKRKRLWEMYPIGSPKGVLNAKRKPKFIGILKFKRIDNSNKIDNNGNNSKNIKETNENDINHLKLNKFILKKEINTGESGDSNDEYVEKLLPPSQAIKVLKKQAVFLTSRDSELELFLDSLNIKYRFTNICKHCLFNGHITVLSSNFSYLYHNQKICKLCAEDTIKRELKLNGFDKKVFRNFKRILDKTGNLDDVLKIMSPKFDSIKNKDLTLFDKINVDKKKFPKIAINRLKLPKKFKDILSSSKNEYLLPVQYLAIKKGLLKNKDLLIVSATGSGKTLIGELAGIPKAINNGKLLFLTPLVALSNQKYRDFTKKYRPIHLKTSIKVGMNRVKAKEELKLPKTNLEQSDIVVGTYEGIDFLLRSGKYGELSNLKTVLIDEIHTLADEDRGSRLNGLIKRIKNLFPDTQIIGLSATIKNPTQLANEFNMDLVEYPCRPVPLERHLAFTRNDVQKKALIKKLVIAESKRKSSKGFKGQTIIFTNSRRKTHKIADSLSKAGINASPYHAGLSYYKKEKIEKSFLKGSISAVVTTAALAAGVDFPASQVIFESLLMGNKWISPNEFSQMLGRAGRPSFHDRGLIYLIPELNNKFDSESEESMAISLLESDVENVNIEYTEDDIVEQVLADISSNSINNINELEEFYKNINIPISIDSVINILDDYNLLENTTSTNNNNKDKIISTDKLSVSEYGKAVSISFLNIEDAEFIKKSIIKLNTNLNKKKYLPSSFKNINNNKNINNGNNKRNNNININSKNRNNNKNINNNNNNRNNKDKNNININSKIAKLKNDYIKSNILYIGLNLEPFNNAYLTSPMHMQIVNNIKTNFSTNLFADSTLDIISSGETIVNLDSKFQDALIKIQTDFGNCKCKEKPFCDCLEKNISKFIIKQRFKHKDPVDISKYLNKHYQIQTYPGDIFSWLDSLLHYFEAVKRISYSFNKKRIAKHTDNIIKSIEIG
ncbi:MAG: DUF5814 domain-containing protein [Methanobacteriaceae archaeon]